MNFKKYVSFTLSLLTLLGYFKLTTYADPPTPNSDRESHAEYDLGSPSAKKPRISDENDDAYNPASPNQNESITPGYKFSDSTNTSHGSNSDSHVSPTSLVFLGSDSESQPLFENITEDTQPESHDKIFSPNFSFPWYSKDLVSIPLFPRTDGSEEDGSQTDSEETYPYWELLTPPMCNPDFQSDPSENVGVVEQPESNIGSEQPKEFLNDVNNGFLVATAEPELPIYPFAKTDLANLDEEDAIALKTIRQRAVGRNTMIIAFCPKTEEYFEDAWFRELGAQFTQNNKALPKAYPSTKKPIIYFGKNVKFGTRNHKLADYEIRSDVIIYKSKFESNYCVDNTTVHGIAIVYEPRLNIANPMKAFGSDEGVFVVGNATKTSKPTKPIPRRIGSRNLFYLWGEGLSDDKNKVDLQLLAPEPSLNATLDYVSKHLEKQRYRCGRIISKSLPKYKK